MSKSIILELRQEESTIQPLLVNGETQNGDYEIVLDNAVMLEEGDQVSLKAVYLDTAQAGSGTLHIQNDMPTVFTVALYQQNYNLDQAFDFKGPAVTDPLFPAGEQPLREYTGINFNTQSNPTTDFKGDNNKWWLSSRSNKTAGEEYFQITNVIVKPIIKTQGYAYFGGTTLHYKYTPITPGAVRFSGNAQVKVGRHLRYNYEEFNPYILSIQCKNIPGTSSPDIKLVSGLTAKSKIATATFQKVVPMDGDLDYFVLQTFDIPFTVKAGDYTPTELTQLVNDKITDAQYNGFATDDTYGAQGIPVGTNPGWAVMNPLLTSVLKNAEYLYNTSLAIDPNNGDLLKQVFVNATENSVVYKYPDFPDKTILFAGETYYEYPIDKMKKETRIDLSRPPLDRYIGTNQFALSLDPNELKIKFDILHFPVYGNSSSVAGSSPTRVNDAVPCVQYNDAFQSMIGENPQFAVEKGLVLRYGGVAMVSMEPADFWINTLGFGECLINPQYTAKCKTVPATPVPTEPNSFVFDCVDGINTTGAFPGLDIGVQHHEDFYSQPIFQETGSGVVNTTISVSDTYNVFASRVYNQVIADEGYFKVNIMNNFQQEMVSSGLTMNSTQSIVNRFYTANSFTSDQGAGSIAYTHVGAPQLLSNFKIQITNPDNELVDPTILREKNTLFVEILKAIPQLEEPDQSQSN